MQQRISKILSLLPILCFSHLARAITASPDTPEQHHEFPRPQDDACRAPNCTRICNPDMLLTAEEVSTIDHMIHDYFESVTFFCHGKDNANYSIGLQLGVYIEKRHDSNNNQQPIITTNSSDPKTKAIAIHNDWGIGYQTECGGSGLLLYLAVDDRQMFISRGKALATVLNDKSLHFVVDAMAPYLREGLFAKAIETAILDLTVAVQKTPKEAASSSSFVQDFFMFGFLGLAVCCFCCFQRCDERHQEELAQNEQRNKLVEKLKEMDVLNQYANENKFYMARSCPICLEPFPASSIKSHKPNSTPFNTSRGYNNRYNDEPYNIHNVQDHSVTVSFSSEETPLMRNRKRVGSDGLPLRLLSCGHVFDETCISDWISRSPNPTSECPICRTTITSSLPKHEQQERLSNNFLTGTGFHQRAYDQERRYRLQRIREQYPQFMTDTLVENWARENYTGSLLQDFNRHREQIDAELRRARQQQHGIRGDSGDGDNDFGGGSADGGGVSGSW